MVEFLVVALPLFLLGIVVIEVTRWAVARQAANYALFEAARAGTVTGADPRAVHDAFERGLIPLLGAGQTDLVTAQRHVIANLAAQETDWGVPGYRLTRVQPSTRHFDRHADPMLTRTVGAGRRVIDNRYLRERSSAHAGQQPSLMEANILVLDMTYVHAPLFPGMRQVIKVITSLASGDDAAVKYANLNDVNKDAAYARAAYRQGLLVIRRDIAMPMQTHPIEFRWERGRPPAENPRRTANGSTASGEP